MQLALTEDQALLARTANEFITASRALRRSMPNCSRVRHMKETLHDAIPHDLNLLDQTTNDRAITV